MLYESFVLYDCQLWAKIEVRARGGFRNGQLPLFPIVIRPSDKDREFPALALTMDDSYLQWS